MLAVFKQDGHVIATMDVDILPEINRKVLLPAVNSKVRRHYKVADIEYDYQPIKIADHQMYVCVAQVEVI